MSEEIATSSQESPNVDSDPSLSKDTNNAPSNPEVTSAIDSELPKEVHAFNKDIQESISNDNDIESSATEISNTPDNEARLQQLEKEHETLRSQYVRIAADFDNFRKRQTRDQDDLRLQLTCSTLSSILPVVDNFDRARQQLDPQGEEAQTLHRSYQGLYKQLVDVLKQLGVAPMRVVGQLFDPTLHEAVLREPSEEQPEDVVIEELQRGYHLNGRVLRHALVKVSMGPGPNGENPKEEVSKSNVENSLNEEAK